MPKWIVVRLLLGAMIMIMIMMLNPCPCLSFDGRMMCVDRCRLIAVASQGQDQIEFLE